MGSRQRSQGRREPGRAQLRLSARARTAKCDPGQLRPVRDSTLLPRVRLNLRQQSHLILQLRPPGLAPALRRAVEDAPHWPHEVDVAHFLAWIGACEPQLAAPRVPDLLAAALEDVSERKLLAVRAFGAVITI